MPTNLALLQSDAVIVHLHLPIQVTDPMHVTDFGRP